MSPTADAVIRRLDAARQKWWFFTLLTSTVMAAAVSLAMLLVLMAGDALLKFPRPGLVGAFFVWLAVSLALAIMVGRRLLRNPRSLEAAARRVEAEFPQLGSQLINLVQLAEDRQNVDRSFCDAAVKQAAWQLQGFPFAAAAAEETRRRRFRNCMQTPRDLAESLIVLFFLLVIALVCQRLLPTWGSAANRLLTPWQFVPSVGKVHIINVSPGDTQVMAGTDLEVFAQIKNPDGRAIPGRIFVAAAGEKEVEAALAPDGKNEIYKLTLPAVIKPLAYRLEIGDSQTRIYAVEVREKPTVAEVALTLHYPDYLGGGKESIVQKQADLDAPQFTEAELQIRPSVSVAQGFLQLENERFAGRIEEDGRLRVKIPLLRNGAFTIHLSNDAGHADPNPRVNQIHVSVDQPPSVELLKPPRESTAAPGVIPVTIRAGDDHGLGLVRLEMKIEGADAASRPATGTQVGDSAADSLVVVKTWNDFGNHATTTLRHYQLQLKPDELKPGQTVLLRAVAVDRREVHQWGLDLKPQETASAWHSVKIIDPASQSAAALEQVDRLQEALWKILEQQLHARSGTPGIIHRPQLAQRTTLAGGLRTEQVDIQKAAVELVKSIIEGESKSRSAVKRALNKLAFGEMIEAVQQCDRLLKIKQLDAFKQPVADLAGVQDRVIDALRKLLDTVRQARNEVLAEAKKRPGSELPDDTRHKLEEARDKLDEFLRQQKKLIEATENLAKKPVEDFTQEDKDLLKKLAAAEDDWSKFAKELHSDLSKLSEQDFANASMAKELVEVQTELKMAADALLKKSVDIAVPLEQLGYERAEELKTNIEKWLPDTPDREKWSQEESLSDQDKEAPMAELPGELQDIVGDLMEKEEDLFDEMEDVSSSAVDSGDKGIGWDATDGPISNNSGKGVTGNRLPNSNEMSGRSGEGRQGKSSGEFVGDQAVGKGGRNTPSRLTPDAYVKGKIKDRSKDPVGGATGGGKESGQGGEGLQGPTPKSSGPQARERLAGRQAALRNKAEALDLRFQVSNFHHTDLKKMIEAMAQVERDVKAGRYQDALRQRRVLAEGLGNVKQYLQGEFEVRKDATSNLPTDVQKQILGSMQDPSPQGWEELNRQYFQRLSEGQQPPAAGPGTPKPPAK